jgi:hypothetical protein
MKILSFITILLALFFAVNSKPKRFLKKVKKFAKKGVKKLKKGIKGISKAAKNAIKSVKGASVASAVAGTRRF